MSEEAMVGPHRYWLEEDTLLWRPDGEVLSQHAREVTRLFDKILERYGYLLWLVDARCSIPVGHETRVVYVRWFEQRTVCRMAVAAFGASIGARTTASLTLRGVWLVQGMEIPMECFKHEPDARAYLDSHRQLLRGSVP